jgi:glycosyltransferase involved in cell wall biosynthesis
MRIGLVAPPWVPVPPPAYGGTEAVVDVLARGLAARGHDVVLFATGDSTCPVPRHSVFDQPPAEMNITMPELRHVQAAYAEFADRDIVHDHTSVGPVWAAAVRTVAPTIVTVHNRFDEISRPVYQQVAAFAAVTAISDSHRATAPEVPIRAVIHHGLDASPVAVGDGCGGFALFVGRMAGDKGLDDAIRIARAAGIPLRIAAKMRSEDEAAYFHEHIEPELGGGVTFLGEVSRAERDVLLGQAVALLNPIRWPEPFGMVMIEAFACGTPVVAYANGAAPEIVEHGTTGFLCTGEAEAVEALAAANTLDRAACRAAVEGHFSAGRMVEDYERLYAEVMGEPAANSR